MKQWLHSAKYIKGAGPLEWEGAELASCRGKEGHLM